MIPIDFVAPNLTDRQKDIVNPAPERYSGNERDGTGYDYADPRNKFVQQGIHHIYTNYNVFPDIGSDLSIIGPITENNRTITLSDALAYSAVYPQNSKVIINIASQGSLEMITPSSYECWQELEINTRVPSIKKILSITTPESQNPRFQTNMTDQESVLTGSTAVSQLPSFRIELPQGRLRDIETSFRSALGPNASVIREREPIEDTIIYKQPEDIDFDDWTANVTAEKNPVVIYNNPKEQNFYYVARLTNKNPETYDSATSEGQAAREVFKQQALQKLAGFTNRVLPEDTSGILEQMIVEGTYGAPDRPNPPPNSTTWRLTARISNDVIRELESNFRAGENIPHIVKGFTDFLEQANIQRKATIRRSDLKKTTKAADRALMKYSKILSDEQITPDMLRGLNLEAEAGKLSRLPEIITKLLDANNIPDPAPTDLLELSFDDKFSLQCIIYNGDIKTKGLGYTFTNDGIIEDVSSGANLVADVSPTSYGFLFYARDMVEASRNTRDPMPWSEFIPSFTYPNPCVKPTEIQNKIEENKRKNKSGPTEKDKLFKTDSEVQSQVNAALGLTEKLFYNAVKSTLGSCDSASATVLKDAILIYNTIYGKSSPRKLAIRAATVLRDQLLERKLVEKQLVADVETAARYASNPDIILREVEKEVNDALYCLFGALGEAIVEQVLEPLGASPSVKKLTRDVVSSSRPRLDFKRGSTTDFYKSWRKNLERLLVKFISQLIYTAFRDMLKAALACGLEETDQLAGAPKKLRSAYGALQVNDLVDRKGGIDLVEVASESGILNRVKNENGDVVNISPTESQIRQFNQDASDILLPEETASLLGRQSSERTRAIIEEVVYSNSPQKSESDFEVLQAENSLNLQDEKYATLTITKETMSEYFGVIGDLLEDLVEDVLEDLSSADEYCSPDSNQDLGNFGGVSNQQAEEQVKQQINSILNKVDQLCEITSDDFNFGLDLSDFEGLLAPPKFYTDFIERLRIFGRIVNDALSEAMSANAQIAALPAPSPPPYTETELWRAITSNPNYAPSEYLRPRATKDSLGGLGFINKELTYKFGGLGTDQQYIELSWDKNQAKLEVGRSALDNADTKQKSTERIIAITSPATTNAPSLSDSYNITTGLRPVNINSRNTPSILNNLNLIYTTGEASVQNRLRELQHVLTNNVYGPNIGQWDSTNRQRLIRTNGGDANDYNFIGLLANSSEHINHTVRGIYLLQDVAREGVAETGEQKLRAFMSTIIQVPFEPNGDPCYETPEEFRARMMAESIQSHLANFFMNIVPLFRAYHGWQTPDTLNLIAAYVYQSIKYEAKSDGVFPFYISEMENFTDVYSRRDQESRGLTDINLKQFDNPYQRLEYYIRQAISETLKRLSAEPMNFLTDKNLFEDPTLREKYHKLSNYFKRGVVETGSTRIQGFAISPDFPDLYIGQGDPANPENRVPFTFRNIANIQRTTVENVRQGSRQFFIDRGIERYINRDPDFDLARIFTEIPGDQRPINYGIVRRSTASILGGTRAVENSLNNIPNSVIFLMDDETFAKEQFLNFVPIPYILAAYAAYYDRVVDLKEKTTSTKFYAYRRVAAANDAFINAVVPDNLADSLRYFSPFPVRVAGVDFFTFADVRNAVKFYRNLISKAQEVIDAREVIQENLDAANDLLTNVESNGDGRLDDMREQFEEQQNLLNYYTGERSITYEGALIGSSPGDVGFTGPRYGTLPNAPDRPNTQFNLLITKYTASPDGTPTGPTPTRTERSPEGFISVKYKDGLKPFYWNKIEEINKSYYDDAYGPAWARWFFGAGGEIDRDEDSLKEDLRQATIKMMDNIRPFAGGSGDDRFDRSNWDLLQRPGVLSGGGNGLSTAFGLEPRESGPFAKLKEALLDLSVTYFTGPRVGGSPVPGVNEPEERNRVLFDSVPSNIEELRRANEARGLGFVYSPGSELNIDGLRGTIEALETFLRNNDVGNWENT